MSANTPPATVLVTATDCRISVAYRTNHLRYPVVRTALF